jgi:hypothetical protein
MLLTALVGYIEDSSLLGLALIFESFCLETTKSASFASIFWRLSKAPSGTLDDGLGGSFSDFGTSDFSSDGYCSLSKGIDGYSQTGAFLSPFVLYDR